jgi:uncharacterized protein involved in exopolysaccharide biosynthesis
MEELTLADYFIILRRWKNIFLTTVCVLLVLTVVFVLRWSNYRSTAVVQIEQPEISSNATAPLGSTRDTIEAMADQRISVMEQKVLSTSSLIEIITKFDLYASARKHKPIADIAENMRKKIKLDLVSSTLANPSSANKESLSAIAFNLSFDYGDPLLAQQVTDELVTRFLDQDLKERRTETQETTAFLETQIAALEASLSEQEKKIADYQKEHGVSRPENLAFNQQAAATITLDLQNIDGQISTVEGNLGSLRAQLATVDPYSRVIADGQVLTTPSIQLKALQAQYATLTAQYGPEHPDVVKIRHQIEALQSQVGRMSKDAAQLKAQIIDVRTNLEAAQKTYGPEHPDVVALQNQLQKLEDQLATRKQRAPTSGEDILADADNPAYLQLVAQLHAAEEQHKSLVEQRKELQAQQENYQKAVSENPEDEKEMAELSRDYDNSQLRYRELKEKKMAADMDEQMQKDRKGERLTLIDPPELPLNTHPPRILLIVCGLFLSFLGGIFCVTIAQILSSSVIGIRHLEALVGVAPLVAIPHIFTKYERQRSWQHKIQMLWNVIAKRYGQP